MDTTFPPSLDQELYLQAAFNASITGGTFLDTKFLVFSRRRSSGIVDRPLALYASSTILRSSSPYFSRLLGRGFVECELSDLDAGFPIDKPDFTSNYEYEDDSDLEDEIDTDNKELGALLDVGFRMGEDSNEANETDGRGASSNSNGRSVEFTPPTNGGSRLGHVVYVPDIAFVTWRALIFYLATKKIRFSSTLKPTSQEALSDIIQPPPCSPKSMYRVAHRLDLEPLKKLALDQIRQNLSSTSILRELFSPFTARYPALIEMEVEFYCGLLDATPTEDVPHWCENIVNGHLSHSGPALTELIRKLTATRFNAAKSPPATAAPSLKLQRAIRFGINRG